MQNEFAAFVSPRNPFAQSPPQSGNARFLSYIPSWWKNLPRLVRGGGAAALQAQSSFTIFIRYKVAVYAPGERAHTLPLHISSLPLCTLSCFVWIYMILTDRLSAGPSYPSRLPTLCWLFGGQGGWGGNAGTSPADESFTRDKNYKE